jgi:hypothetical protein
MKFGKKLVLFNLLGYLKVEKFQNNFKTQFLCDLQSSKKLISSPI